MILGSIPCENWIRPIVCPKKIIQLWAWWNSYFRLRYFKCQNKPHYNQWRLVRGQDEGLKWKIPIVFFNSCSLDYWIFQGGQSRTIDSCQQFWGSSSREWFDRTTILGWWIPYWLSGKFSLDIFHKNNVWVLILRSSSLLSSKKF